MYMWAEARGPHIAAFAPTVDGQAMREQVESLHLRSGNWRAETWRWLPHACLCREQPLHPHPGCCQHCFRLVVVGELVMMTRGKMAAGTFPKWMGQVYMCLSTVLDLALDGQRLAVLYYIGYSMEGDDGYATWGACRLRVINYYLARKFLLDCAGSLHTVSRPCPTLDAALFGGFTMGLPSSSSPEMRHSSSSM